MDIVWRRMALDDREAARRFIAENNPRAADRVPSDCDYRIIAKIAIIAS